MKVIKTIFEDLIIIEPTIHTDKRGNFTEIFSESILNNHLSYNPLFCQHNLVYSKKNVLRGLHFQEYPYDQSKLITVMTGEIFDVAVDLRKESKTYGKYFSINLNSLNRKILFIPKGFAHGYLSLKSDTIVEYKVDNYYNLKSERGIKYDDKLLNIDWNCDLNKILISEKDKNFPEFVW